MTNYTVQAGDTLSKIAKAHGTTVSELAKQNGITDVNKIEIGQELSLGKTTDSTPTPHEEQTVGLDSFEKKSAQNSNDISPFAYATGGAVAYGVGSKVLPKATSEARTLYSSAKTGMEKAYAKMKATAKHNAKAVRTFVAQKAKHAAKSAELHYAFGKDAVQQGVQRSGNAVKNVAHNVAAKARHAAKSAELHYAFGKDAVQQGVQRSGNAVKNVTHNVAQKAKHAAKSAELHYAFGKDAVQKGAKNAINKAKVGGRYTRFIANTKVAPKLIKGASRCAGPLTAIYGMYEVKTAYDKGGEKAAVKQAVKTGGGLAGGWAGAKVGAAVGSFAGPIGTVIGSVAGGILGYCLGEKLCS